MSASAHERLEALASLDSAAEGLKKDGGDPLSLSKALLACAGAIGAFGPALPFSLLDGHPFTERDLTEEGRLCAVLTENAVAEALDALSEAAEEASSTAGRAAAKLLGSTHPRCG